MQQCRIAIINESSSNTGSLVSFVKLLWESIMQQKGSSETVSTIVPCQYIIDLVKAYYPINVEQNQYLQLLSNVTKMVHSFNPDYAHDMLIRNLPKHENASLLIVYGIRDEKSIQLLSERGFKIYFHSKTIEQRAKKCKTVLPAYEYGDLVELLTEDTYWENIPENIEKLDTSKSDESLAAYIISKAI